MYELTSFLTTIAAASASIVAILGGFIASRLISISSDRESAIERINQIEEELKVRIAEKDRLQKDNDEDDAIDFIEEHISDLLDGKRLGDIYTDSERIPLQQETLSVYWEEATQICYKYFSTINTGSSVPRNSDHIPKVLAKEYANDDFSYNVCLEIDSELQKRIETQKREKSKTNSGLLDAFLENPYIPEMENTKCSDTAEYIKNNDMIAEQNYTITFLKLQRDQILNHINILKEPKGMKQGLIIFALFSVACIICPLLFIPYTTVDLSNYIVVKCVFLVMFSVGLIAIFLYLVYLLRSDSKKG